MSWLVLSRGRLSIAVAILFCSLLAGCQQYWRESGVWDIGEHQGLLLDVSNYYHRHALEEGGRCKSPYIDGVTQAETVNFDNEILEVHLQYYYRDFLNDGNDDCDRRLRPLRCTVLRECRGFGAREFQVAKSEDGFDILGMSGLRNNRR